MKRIIFPLISLLIFTLACKRVPVKNLQPSFDGNKWGFVDQYNKMVIDARYDMVLPFSEGLAAVKLQNKWGFINQSGDEIVEPTAYIAVGSFSEGMAKVNLNGRWGFIDATGKEIITPDNYLYVGEFSQGLAFVYDNEGYGFIDKSGKVKIPLAYQLVWNFDHGISKVLLNNKFGYIDKNGIEIIPIVYDHISNFTDGKALAQINGEWRFIDQNGNQGNLLPYLTISNPDNRGFYKVFNQEKYGFINNLGNEIIPLKYDYIEDFENDIAIVNNNGNFGVIDRHGNELVPLQFKNIGIKNGREILLEDYNRKNYLLDIWGNGMSILKEETVNSNISTNGEFIDSRDGKKYSWTSFGKQVWMNENLQYQSKGSKCYEEHGKAACEKYGRYYSWEMANSVCPEGWKLPSVTDYNQLINQLGGLDKAYVNLIKGGNSKLNFDLGGYVYNAQTFENVNDNGYFWTSTSVLDHEATSIWLNSYEQSVLQFSEGRNHLRNVRCIKK